MLLDWLTDVLILVGVAAIGWAMYMAHGAPAVVGYVGGLCLALAGLVTWRSRRAA